MLVGVSFTCLGSTARIARVGWSPKCRHNASTACRRRFFASARAVQNQCPIASYLSLRGLYDGDAAKKCDRFAPGIRGFQGERDDLDHPHRL